LLLPALIDTTSAIRFENLHLNPIALDLGLLQIRWYSLGYIAGILIGWRYLLRLLAQPNAPMARRHADDFVFYATMGILVGGRLGYVVFYQPDILLHPLDVLKLWQGGMSFHGGALGVSIGILLFARKHGLNWLRVHDYIACCTPFGLFFVRIANFINGELWGRPTDVPWAVIFPGQYAGDIPRHPSQLYEAGLEGIVLGLVLAFFFWKTRARVQPGKLVGIFLLGYGLSRFFVEFFREPDVQLGTLSWGLTMGQTLTLPMLAGGVYLITTASKRTLGGIPGPE
jgi:phosphatidylglycerol:prolipoprotein diacylglycerol transferase